LKTRYFIRLSFNGANYHGWQIQPNARTVQEVLNQDLSLLLGEEIQVTGCGRTDTGVHARVFYAHMDCSRERSRESRDQADDPDFLFRINHKLPADIAIQEILPVRPDAHARFDATSRTYIYQISRKKEVFNPDQSHYLYGELDFQAMQQAGELLKEYTDFTSFSKVDTDTRTNDCRIDLAHWDVTEETLAFTIQADRFLRNMVRAIVGTMLDLGFGKIDLDGFRRIIESRDRSHAGTSAPARGLFLADVQYPPEIFL
jgi:tRNA pseudouridine38-40 synthase